MLWRSSSSHISSLSKLPMVVAAKSLNPFYRPFKLVRYNLLMLDRTDFEVYKIIRFKLINKLDWLYQWWVDLDHWLIEHCLVPDYFYTFLLDYHRVKFLFKKYQILLNELTLKYLPCFFHNSKHFVDFSFFCILSFFNLHLFYKYCLRLRWSDCHLL